MEDRIKKIVLARENTLGGGWGQFKENVAIDENNEIYYRRTDGGNCEAGKWNEWKGEKEALEFIFGDVNISKKLITELKKCFASSKKLSDRDLNMDGY